jgi:hypothetical protein
MEKTPQGNYFSILHSLNNIGMISTFIGGKTERLKPLMKHNRESICVRYRKHDKCIKCIKFTNINNKIGHSMISIFIGRKTERLKVETFNETKSQVYLC